MRAAGKKERGTVVLYDFSEPDGKVAADSAALAAAAAAAAAAATTAAPTATAAAASNAGLSRTTTTTTDIGNSNNSSSHDHHEELARRPSHEDEGAREMVEDKVRALVLSGLKRLLRVTDAGLRAQQAQLDFERVKGTMRAGAGWIDEYIYRSINALAAFEPLDRTPTLSNARLACFFQTPPSAKPRSVSAFAKLLPSRCSAPG